MFPTITLWPCEIIPTVRVCLMSRFLLLLILEPNLKPLESTVTVSLQVLAIVSLERLCSRLISAKSRLRMSQQPIPFRRSLLSLILPKYISAALTRNGYETVADVSSVTPEELSKSKQGN